MMTTNPTRLAFFFLLLHAALWTATPVWAGQIGLPWSLLWYSDVAPAVSPGDSSEVSERLTLDDAIALALDANRLAKNPRRLQLVTESVKQTYAGALRAQRTLEVREAKLKTSREVDRLMVELGTRGEAPPAAVLETRAALAVATADVFSARRELTVWARQLNHLMGRDPQARLLVSPEPEATAAAASRAGVDASGQ